MSGRTAVILAAAFLACGACGDDSADTSGSGAGSDGGSLQDGSSGSDGAIGQDGGGSDSGGGDASGPTCPGAKPDATNTGVPVGTSLTTVNGDVTVTTDGTVIDAQDIHGFLIIQASHVKVTRSIVRGPDGGTAATTAIIRVDSGTDITIEDVEVNATTPSVDMDGMSGSFVGHRLNVHGGVDGMKLGDNADVECSYIHDMVSFASDPNQGGGPTHNDAIQILAGSHIHIVGNNLVAATDQNSAIQVTQDFGVVADLHIEHNWGDGGGCTFNFSHNGQASLTDVHTLDNRFGRNSSFSCPILRSNETTLDSQGDVYDDDGTPVPIQHHD